MSDLLRDVMRGLADEATPVTLQPDTWRRGRRSHVLRLAGAGLAAVLVVVAGISVFAASKLTSSPQPASKSYDPKALAIPDRIWTPSPWTAGTDDDGPLGPLAFIAIATRQTSWFHANDHAWFGVSAVDGEYRFLDLPGYEDTGTDPALSPDGTRIAYFYAGRLPGTDGHRAILGYAIYNSVTGEVLRHRVPATYGLAISGSLLWSGDGRYLLAAYGFRRGLQGPAFSAGDVFDLDSQQAANAPQTFDDGLLDAGAPAPGGVAFFERGVNPVLFDPATGTLHRFPVNPYAMRGYGPTIGPMLSPSGRALVFGGNLGEENGPRAFSARWGDGREALQVREVPGSRPWLLELFGWTDESHLLVEKWKAGFETSERYAAPEIYRLEVGNGDLRPAIAVVLNGGSFVEPHYAQDLLVRPFASRAAPPRPHDPRILWTLVCLALFAALLLLLAIRRRGLTRPIDKR